MDAQEFGVFIERAFAVLATMLGVDPMTLANEARGAVA
jgi:hypothetical protein